MLFTGALVGFGQAQSSDQIIFSKPVDDGIKSPTADVDAPTANTVVPPRGLTPSFFDPRSDMPRLAPPARLNLQRTPDKGSWAFMTPEQIMGVQTPEQMLGLPDKNDDKFLTPEQRFIKRQQDVKLAMMTNGASSLSLWRSDADSNPFGQRNTSSAFSKPGQPANPNSPDADSPKDFSQYLNAPQNSVFNINQKFTGRATGAFATPASGAPKVDLEQEAAMERFRTLIGSSQQPNNSFSPTFQSSSLKTQPATKSDIFGRPLANSASELKQPSTLTPLPTVTGNYTVPATPKKNWWAPQPAPWLSPGLQPNGLSAGPPARKF